MINPEKVYLSADIPAEAREWRNQKAIWKYCRQNTLISQAGQEKWLERIENDPSIKMFGVNLVEDDKAVGVAGLTSISLSNGSAEFSLYIAPNFQGKGYAKEALVMLLDHSFSDWRLERVWGEVFDYNLRAAKLFKDIGFKEEGVLRHSYFKEGKFINSTIISILRDEFEGKYGVIK